MNVYCIIRVYVQMYVHAFYANTQTLSYVYRLDNYIVLCLIIHNAATRDEHTRIVCARYCNVVQEIYINVF